MQASRAMITFRMRNLHKHFLQNKREKTVLLINFDYNQIDNCFFDVLTMSRSNEKILAKIRQNTTSET